MIRKFMFYTITLSLIFTAFQLQAQPTAAQNKQFIEIMMAFPNEFTSINNGAPKYNITGRQFNSKVSIEGTEQSYLMKNYNTDKIEFICVILGDEDADFKMFTDAFASWKKKIAQLDFNGAKLVPYISDKYKNDNMYKETASWRLDNSTNNIATQYQKFTVCLELLDLDQGGYMVRVVVTDK